MQEKTTMERKESEECSGVQGMDTNEHEAVQEQQRLAPDAPPPHPTTSNQSNFTSKPPLPPTHSNTIAPVPSQPPLLAPRANVSVFPPLAALSLAFDPPEEFTAHASPAVHHSAASSSSSSSAHHPHRSSRLRGDGFLLDEDEEDESEDATSLGGLVRGETGDSLSALPLQRISSSNGSLMTSADGMMDEMSDPTATAAAHMPMHLPLGLARPRSADLHLLHSSGAAALSDSNGTGSNGNGNRCPSCGNAVNPAKDGESFHAHVSRCFLTHHVLPSSLTTKGRPPRTPQATPLRPSLIGPIRRTRRAASAAQLTATEADRASAWASNVDVETASPVVSPATDASSTAISTTPLSSPSAHPHSYHPYASPSSSASSVASSSLNDTLAQLRRAVEQLDLHQRISMMEAFAKLSKVASAEAAAAAAAANAQQHITTAGYPSPRGKRLRSATSSPSPKHKPVDDRINKELLAMLYSPVRTPAPVEQVNNSTPIGHIPSPLVIGMPAAPHAAGGPFELERSVRTPADHDSGVATPSVGTLSMVPSFTQALNACLQSPLAASPISTAPSESTDTASVGTAASSSQALQERFPAHCFPDPWHVHNPSYNCSDLANQQQRIVRRNTASAQG